MRATLIATTLLVLALVTPQAIASTIVTVFCYANVLGGPPLIQQETGQYSAACSLTGSSTGSSASGTADDFGDLFVTAGAAGGSMDPLEGTTAQASWTAPAAEIVTWSISWDQLAENSLEFSTDDGRRAPIGGGPPTEVFWTATLDAGATVTAFASADGGSADLTAQVVSVTLVTPEPGTLYLIIPFLACLPLCLRKAR